MAKKRRKKKRKSFNPFKMWGSWIGAGMGLGILFIASLIISKNVFSFLLSPLYVVNILFGCMGEFCSNNPFFEVFIGMIFSWGLPIIGFLVGWGVHSLIRKLRK